MCENSIYSALCHIGKDGALLQVRLMSGTCLAFSINCETTVVDLRKAVQMSLGANPDTEGKFDNINFIHGVALLDISR